MGLVKLVLQRLRACCWKGGLGMITHMSVHYVFELAVTPLNLFGCDQDLKGPYCLCRHSKFLMNQQSCSS